MPYVTSIERFAMKEGEQHGIEIGEIHAFEKMLRMTPTPLEVLKKLSNEELRRLAQELEAKLLQ